MQQRLWSFSSKVAKSRSEALLSYENFHAIVRLLSTAVVTSFAWEPFKNESLKGFNRAAFLVQVAPEAYDGFFNSPVGLRAQYALSPVQGESANRLLLSSLESSLLSFKRESTAPSEEEIHWSLCAPEAKIWIHEKEVEVQLGEETPEILYPPWQEKSESGVGLLAPLGKKLEVMGGWLNKSGLVASNPEKANRSNEIHKFGFT